MQIPFFVLLFHTLIPSFLHISNTPDYSYGNFASIILSLCYAFLISFFNVDFSTQYIFVYSVPQKKYALSVVNANDVIPSNTLLSVFTLKSAYPTLSNKPFCCTY